MLQIKEDPKTWEKYYYVHFLNLEKRMDKWISEKSVKRNLGNINKEFEIDSLKYNHSISSEKNMLTRKRSHMMGNETVITYNIYFHLV